MIVCVLLYVCICVFICIVVRTYVCIYILVYVMFAPSVREERHCRLAKVKLIIQSINNFASFGYNGRRMDPYSSVGASPFSSGGSPYSAAAAGSYFLERDKLMGSYFGADYSQLPSSFGPSTTRGNVYLLPLATAVDIVDGLISGL